MCQADKSHQGEPGATYLYDPGGIFPELKLQRSLTSSPQAQQLKKF